MIDSMPKPTSGVKFGFAVGMACHIAGFVIFLLLSIISDLGALACYMIGFSQLIYMIPAVSLAYKRNANRGFIKGMWMSAGLVFLINGTCFGAGLAWISMNGPIGG